jgi:hypothetical protein
MSEAGILKNMIGIECPSIDEILDSEDYPLGAVFADKNELKYLTFKNKSIDKIMKIKIPYSDNSIGTLCENSGEIYYDIENHGTIMPLFGSTAAVKLTNTQEDLLSAGTVDGTFLYATNMGIFRVSDSKQLIGAEEIKKKSINEIYSVIKGEKGAYCLLIMNGYDTVIKPIHCNDGHITLGDEIFRHHHKKNSDRLIASAVVWGPDKYSSKEDTIACLTNGQLFFNGRRIEQSYSRELLSSVNSISLLHKDKKTAHLLINGLNYFGRIIIGLENCSILSDERIETSGGTNAMQNVYSALPVKSREMHEKILGMRR